MRHKLDKFLTEDDIIYDFDPKLMYRRGMYVNRDILYRNINCPLQLFITELTEECIWLYGQQYKIVRFVNKEFNLGGIPQELIEEKEDGYIIHVGYIVNSIPTYFYLFREYAEAGEMIYHDDRIYQKKPIEYVKVYGNAASAAYNAEVHTSSYIVLKGSLVDAIKEDKVTILNLNSDITF